VIKKNRPHGYEVGTLGEARARFTEVRGVAADWQDEETEPPAPEPAAAAEGPGVNDQGQLGLDDLDARCGCR
jgi:hypothetical protein